MSAPTPRTLRRYAASCLRLEPYFEEPGDGRCRPRIPAACLFWALLIGEILRECSFLAVEALIGSAARSQLGVATAFGDDALSYFTERLHVQRLRGALVTAVRQAKRNKAFDDVAHIGLAIDGTGVGRCRKQGCEWCRPRRDPQGNIRDHLHHFAMVSVVGAGFTLPIDLEPYGPGDSEYAAGKRLLGRVVENLGRRFADYVVVDGGFATAPFLHAADAAGLPVIARLKRNLPELFASAQQRFAVRPADDVFVLAGDRIELWDASDFAPWENLHWPWVRVLRYRQHKPDGTVVEAYWLTNLRQRKVGSRSLFKLAKTRWEIENQGFNDAKNRYGMEHIRHHHANSLLAVWLITILALTIERLYRLRHLHRGSHPALTPVQLLRRLRLALAAAPLPPNSS